MFERLIRMAEAKTALRRGRFERVLVLMDEPSVRGDRRAVALRERALRGLMERARARRERGGWSAALADLSRVLTVQPEYDGAQSLREEVRQELAEAETAERTAREMLAEARRLAEEGELDAAVAVCRSAEELRVPAAEVAATRQLIDSRRQAAAELLQRAGAALRAGDPSGARDLLVRARAHARDDAAAAKLAPAVARAVAAALLPELEQLRAAGDDVAAYARLHTERARLPELERARGLAAFTRDSAAGWRAQLVALLDRGELDSAVELYREIDPRLVREPSMATLCGAMDEICRGLDHRDRGDFAGAAECIEKAASALPSKGLRAALRGWERDRATADAALTKARELAAAGQLVEARQRLSPVLERWPMHEVARREMEMLDQGSRDKERRLGRARELAAAGRLDEAMAQVLSLAVPGSQGEEARLLLVEIQARRDLVRNGLDQVRRGIHGRHTASVEGLRHCLGRLEELAKVHTDCDEIEMLREGLEAELDGVDLLSAGRELLGQGRPADLAEKIAALTELMPRLLRVDRLDSRALELADRIGLQAEQAVAAGRLTAAEGWLGALDPLAQRFPDVRERAEQLVASAANRRAKAEAAAARGADELRTRNLAAAEDCLAEARGAWIDGGPVQRLASDLHRVHGQCDALDEVEELAERQDFAAAHRRLEDMPPTPAVLRTRIFDIKQGLARAQGLEAGFLLRVDEGGEFLALRGDTITIGNVRDGHADLAVLANLAGKHATILRSMSFHGGMQDRIRADKGEITVAGRSVAEHPLRSGDRVRLGSALELHYWVPTARSLTASLGLSSGFQVAGTDKVLLMRDRGRDGRILIAASSEAHVRVPQVQADVELYAHKDGQMRVSFAGPGEINGRPFRGEHPVGAGDLVRCGEVSFTLQPWSKAL